MNSKTKLEHNYCGSGSSSGKALGYGQDNPDLIPGVGGGWGLSSLLRDQTGPGVHSTSYTMSTESFSRE